ASVRRESAHVGPRSEGVEVDAGYGINSVDGRESVRAAALGRARDRADVRDVGRELDQHGRARDFLHPLGNHAGVFGDLSDGAAHAALAHAVWAAEVQLESV